MEYLDETTLKVIVPVQALDYVEEQIEKLAKTAKRIMCKPIEFSVLEIRSEPILDICGNDTGKVQQMYVLQFVGETPKYNGWTAVAVIDHGANDIPIIKRIDTSNSLSRVNLDEFRTAKNSCDHCKQKRQRTQTFVIQHDNGEVKRVGRSCLRLFLDASSVLRIARTAEMWMYLQDRLQHIRLHESDFMKSGQPAWKPLVMLQYAACAVRQYRYCSKAKSYETGEKQTSLRVADALSYSDCQIDNCTIHDHLYPNAEDISLAQKALDWVLSFQDEENMSEYQHNVYASLSGAAVDRRHYAFACSAIPSYFRSVAEQKRQDEVAKIIQKSDYVGAVGERCTFTNLKSVASYEISNDYGTSYINVFFDENGNRIVWKTSYPFRKNSLVSFVARVKEHSVYKEVKQTIVTRAANVSVAIQDEESGNESK